MEFLVIARDYTDNAALARRMVVRERHLAAARHTTASGNMLIGGAILDEEGRMVGSMTVVSFPDRVAFDQWLKNVPYNKNGVWERVEVYPYHVTVAARSDPGNREQSVNHEATGVSSPQRGDSRD